MSATPQAPAAPNDAAPASSAPRRRPLDYVLGPKPPAALPRPAEAAMRASQRSSEILVCLVQFAAILFFGAFYLVTPKAFPPSAPFEPVPWVLAIYTVFTVGRFALATADRLTPPFLIASIIVDMAVLMLTIWSFHLQYQTPPTTYLKAPTLLYVFILIALRTMRFEAVYVLIAGAAAVAGWFALVAYAWAEAGAGMVTTDWAVYMTSDAILVGAEVDKALTLIAVTAVLCVATIRARRLAVTAAADSHAASEMSRFFAPEVAGDIREADSGLGPKEGIARDAAVLIVDLRQFTAHAARMAPSDTIALLRDYQARLVPLIQREGGSIDKYLGDGILATFGATRASETYAHDAMRALLAVIDAGEDWRESVRRRRGLDLKIGAAVAVGPVVFGAIGDESRLELTVIGDVVNRTAKLEKHTRTGGLAGLATEEADLRARDQGFAPDRPTERRPGERVAGLGEPLDIVGYRPRSGG